MISDSDHYLPCQTTPVWAWKSLTRGLNPDMLDCGIGDAANPLPDFDPVRDALGDTRRQASRMKLLAMEPRGDLSSTGYALAAPGKEYLVLRPEEASTAFTVTLAPGVYRTEWFNLTDRRWTTAPNVTVAGTRTKTFTPPFATPTPAVLYLRRGRLGG